MTLLSASIPLYVEQGRTAFAVDVAVGRHFSCKMAGAENRGMFFLCLREFFGDIYLKKAKNTDFIYRKESCHDQRY